MFIRHRLSRCNNLLFCYVILSEEFIRSRMNLTIEGSAVEDQDLLRVHHGQQVTDALHGNQTWQDLAEGWGKKVELQIPRHTG